MIGCLILAFALCQVPQPGYYVQQGYAYPAQQYYPAPAPGYQPGYPAPAYYAPAPVYYGPPVAYGYGFPINVRIGGWGGGGGWGHGGGWHR